MKRLSGLRVNTKTCSETPGARAPGDSLIRGFVMKTLALPLALIGFAVNAQAQPIPSVEDAFTILDANRDGAVSIQEAQIDDAIAPRFAEADADNSGFINPDEFAATFDSLVESTTESEESPLH